MRTLFQRLCGGVPAALVVSVLTTISCADSEPDVAVLENPLYLGTLSSMSPGDARTFWLRDRTGVDYTILAGGWFRPVPLDGCDLPFCSNDGDYERFLAWKNQYAFPFMRLRVQNYSSTAIMTRYKSRVDCVYTSGNPLPAPWQTFDNESHDGEFWTSPGETEEFDVGCMNYGAGSTFDDAWPVDASVDISVHDTSRAGDPFEDPKDPLENPWD